MKIMLLSFKPNVYQKIYDGIKIFEHRRNFPADWEQKFSDDEAAVKRIKEYETSYRYAMEVSEFQETTAISLDDLKRDFPSFVVPQSYIYLDKNLELLKYIEHNLKFKTKNIKHDFSCITSD